MHIIKRSRKKHYNTDGLEIDIDAGNLTNEIVDAVHAEVLSSLESGREPGGRTKPAKEKQDGYPRGVTRIGRFLRSIGKTKARGKRKAKAVINYQRFFQRWLAKEDTRGITHIDAPDKVIDEVVRKYLKDAIK